MTDGSSWGWAALLLLGAYHGINPGMGWLFAVALGMQEKSARAVGRSLLPLALGHAVAIGLVAAVAVLARAVLPLSPLKIGVASILFLFGLYRLWRQRHPRWGGMQVKFGDLTVWSFLMASAHGAGFMVVPILLGMSAGTSGTGNHHMPAASLGAPWLIGAATAVHTLGYLVVTGLVAWVVYEKLGLALLRKAWLNLDLLWAVALVATGVFTLLL
ncbi:MAG: hypothetical protein ACE5HB_07840 [Terriglobia bacterium]